MKLVLCRLERKWWENYWTGDYGLETWYEWYLESNPLMRWTYRVNGIDLFGKKGKEYEKLIMKNLERRKDLVG